MQIRWKVKGKSECRISNVEGRKWKANRRTAECRISNVEGRNIQNSEPQNRRMSNIECRRKEFYRFYKIPLTPFRKGGKQVWNLSHTVPFIKKIERSDTTLRHSAVHYSTVLRFAFHALAGGPYPRLYLWEFIPAFQSKIQNLKSQIETSAGKLTRNRYDISYLPFWHSPGILN